MICVAILLLFVPGILTWRISGVQNISDGKDIFMALANWLIHDLIILFCLYTVLYITKGSSTVSFSADYLGEEVYYSVYGIGFVFKYSAMALCASIAIGVAERIICGRKRRR